MPRERRKRPLTTTGPKRSRLPERSPKSSDAFASALKALNGRERSTAEIVRWLDDRGFVAAEIEAAVEQLLAGGALDDTRFAECFAADKRELAGWGEERIAAALIERGVEREVAERAAAEGYAEQVSRAVRLVAERGKELDDDAARNRALGFLTRRGFSYEVAYDAVRKLSRNRR